MSESRVESELKAALDEVYRLAPWLLSKSMAAVRSARPRRQGWAWIAGLAAILLAITSSAFLVYVRHTSNQSRDASVNASFLPKPIPQPITRTSPGAQVAWLSIQSQNQQSSAIAVDLNGRVVGRIDQPADSYGLWRSADGATLYDIRPDQIAAYSAIDGKAQRTYLRESGTVVDGAFSPDGHWLAIIVLGTNLELDLIDLRSGSSQVLQVTRDLDANLPGMHCGPRPNCASSVVWGLVMFSPDSMRIFTLTDWGGPLRLSAFSVANARLAQSATALDGQGRRFPSCGGPAMAAKILAAGNTLVAFCHSDGAVWFFNLTKLTNIGVVQSKQDNPFWLSPIFTPDGQLLYLHQWPSFGDTMQVVDIAKRKLLGPVATPTDTAQSGPFAWMVTNAYAGEVASTVPVSPDGLKLYTATLNGVMVLRIPDLKPLARLASGFKASEVWISGDGQTIYATADDGKLVAVMRAGGGDPRLTSIPAPASRFIASEHG